MLILDVEPTEKMEEAARKAKTLRYQQRADMPPKEYDRVQILTAFEIIEGAKFDCPPTMQAVKRFPRSPTGDAGMTKRKPASEHKPKGRPSTRVNQARCDPERGRAGRSSPP